MANGPHTNGPDTTDGKEAQFKELAAGAQRGDRRAAADLLRGIQDTIYRFSLAQLRDRDTANEATQETALRVLKSITRYDGSSRVTTWALGITLNVCRELRRKQNRHESEDQLDSLKSKAPLASQTVERNETSAQLKKSLGQLPPRQREAITLRYLEQLSIRETAQAMDCSEGTVKATIWQALRRLRSELTDKK